MSLPFVGCDGEGAGKDPWQRQLYRLLRIGDDELYEPDKTQSLRTENLLRFIMQSPEDAILVGFFFDYDVTMILRDITPGRRDHLLARSHGYSSRTKVGDYLLSYIPRKSFTIQREADKKTRIIHDVGTIFQCSFVKALRAWKIGDEDTWRRIEIEKARRSAFTDIGSREREYCRDEVRLLQELMETLREACNAAGLFPPRWEGAGDLATAMLRAHEIPRRVELPDVPNEAARLVSRAYFGGRFEISAHGKIDRPVYEYDINSAYPAAMLSLPCPLHSRWKRGEHGPHCVKRVEFDHPRAVNLCGLPMRQKTGTIAWPRKGHGVYWSVELEAARKLGTTWQVREAWSLVTECSCAPCYGWLPEMYAERKALGKSGKGVVLKLGMNALYGKTAQRIGAAPYFNLSFAGLMTAITRATLIDAAALDVRNIVMLATDALYSLAPLKLPISGDLGAWEESIHPDLFIMQPGVYWDSIEDVEKRRVKTRGINLAKLIDARDTIETAWNDWLKMSALGGCPEPVTIETTQFIGLRLAHSRGKDYTAGRWDLVPRRASFDWTGKRSPILIDVNNVHRSVPKPYCAENISIPAVTPGVSRHIETEGDEYGYTSELFPAYGSGSDTD